MFANQIGEPLPGDHAEACDRLLHEGEKERGEREDPEEAQPRGGAERGVRRDAARIVPRDARDQSRANDGKEGERAAAATEGFAQPKEGECAERGEAARCAARKFKRSNAASIGHLRSPRLLGALA